MKGIHTVDLDDSVRTSRLLIKACRELNKHHPSSLDSHDELGEWWNKQDEVKLKKRYKSNVIFALGRFYRLFKETHDINSEYQYEGFHPETKVIYENEVRPIISKYLYWSYYPTMEDRGNWIVENVTYTPDGTPGEFSANPGFAIWFLNSEWRYPEDCLMYQSSTSELFIRSI
jgi:hypothetical protein